jgi:protein Mpv17
MIPSTRTAAVLGKMAIDQTVFAPAIMFSFFAGQGLLEGMSRDEVVEKFKHAFWPTMQANWTVWPLAQVINFKFVPQTYQTLYINFVSLGWNTYLSMANAKAVKKTHAMRALDRPTA